MVEELDPVDQNIDKPGKRSHRHKGQTGAGVRGPKDQTEVETDEGMQTTRQRDRQARGLRDRQKIIKNDAFTYYFKSCAHRKKGLS